jgi:hypothetical protein
VNITAIGPATAGIFGVLRPDFPAWLAVHATALDALFA